MSDVMPPRHRRDHHRPRRALLVDAAAMRSRGRRDPHRTPPPTRPPRSCAGRRRAGREPEEVEEARARPRSRSCSRRRGWAPSRAAPSTARSPGWAEAARSATAPSSWTGQIGRCAWFKDNRSGRSRRGWSAATRSRASEDVKVGDGIQAFEDGPGRAERRPRMMMYLCVVEAQLTLSGAG